MKHLLTTLMLGLSAAAIGCGPYFPSSYLASEAPRMPDFKYAYDLELLGRHFYPDAWAGELPESGGLSTPDATRNDFPAAAAALPAERKKEALDAYLAFDKACRAGDAPQFNAASLPPQLREFYLYSAGYAEMRKDPACLEPEAWKELLALPAETRKFRTTWVHYMLGNLAMKRSAGQAYKHYRELRLAKTAGFADSCGLAERSGRLNWLLADNPFDKLRYLAADRITPLWEKNFTRLAAEARKQDEERMLKDPLLREIALLVFDPLPILEKLPDDCRPLILERLAAGCYFQNRLDTCRALLPKLPEDSLVRLYLEARFAKREGNQKLAAEKLSKWLSSYRKQSTPAWKFPDAEKGTFYQTKDQIPNFPEEVQGVLGTVRVDQQDFLEALHAFMQSESWLDAAVVAEQLLPTDKLIEYCRNHAADPKNSSRQRLRYLLARRLMREYRVREASEFFPPEIRPIHDLYLAANLKANTLSLSKDERALALFQLGRILRRKGFELRATELEPDHFYMGGNHEELPTQKWRDGQYPVGEEWRFFDRPRGTELLNWSVPLPNLNRITRRFHYRRNAADFFARAGALAENPALRSASFWAAGFILKDRHPDEANGYFQMLCDNGDAPMAAEARKLNWLPPNPKLEKFILKEPLTSPVSQEDIMRTATP
ncbi:MAG: hypothetical protein HPZ91_10890 [Lentisphaeria bacterium]|nr:hypothetical protein [Lentisphaeria bacterium]